MKILYVEHDDDNLYMLKTRLERCGDFEVLAAEDSEQGCKLAVTEHPDVILIDLEMPVMDRWKPRRRLLLVYLARINELADRPEFYHLLTNSCTINIVRYANAAGRVGRLDVRHLLNGLVDSYLYFSGRIDTTLPLDELRRRSQINEAAQAADGAPDFSQRIRASLPTISR